MRLVHGDCMEVLKRLPPESVDLLVTDPPYRLIGGGCTPSSTKHPIGGIFSRRLETARKGTLFQHNAIPFDAWLPEAYRVLKPGTHAYVMTNPRNLKALWLAAEKAGFAYQALLVWKKNNVMPSCFYMHSYELILMLRKGKAKAIRHPGTPSCLEVNNIAPGRKLHPAEKPEELMRILIENSSAPGDTVLDPFMGSGTTGVVCARLSRDFIGIEMDDAYFETAENRIKEAEHGLRSVSAGPCDQGDIAGSGPPDARQQYSL